MALLGKAIFNSSKKVVINRSFWPYLFVCGCLALVFTYFYFLYTHEYPPGSYAKIASFEAHKVFQTRILITSIGNFMEPLLPIIRFCFDWLVPYPINYEVILQLINCIFVTILLICMPHLAFLLGYHINKYASIFILIPISWNYIFINGLIDGAGLYYPYDIPSLTFFALGIILFMQKKWYWFYPVFLLACLNRESACFITLGGCILGIRVNNVKFKELLTLNKAMIFHLIVQSLIWLVLRLILCFAFRNNPGEFFEQPHSMIDFISRIWTGKSHWAMENPLWFITLFAGIWIIPVLKFENLNQLTKRFLGLGIIYILILTVRSNMMEARVYNELNIILGVAALCCFFGRKISNSQELSS